MLYTAYQMHHTLLAPLRAMASIGQTTFDAFGLRSSSGLVRHLDAAYHLLVNTRFSHDRPAFGIDEVEAHGERLKVREEAAAVTPFCTLLRFKKEGVGPEPRVLVVAPLSGHFSTLLRNTVKTLIPHHDVFITDWHNARDVAVSDGRFGFSEYIEHIIHFLEVIGPGAHVLAVCQPCVQVLAAVSVMAEEDHPAQPRSMVLMAGPIDTRASPTKVNELAQNHSIDWFEKKLISTVPARHEGAGRKVYPGFMQLIAFMSMHMERHYRAHHDLYDHLAKGEFKEAQAISEFYDEYFAVLDLTAEFYLETVQIVFQEMRLAKGELTFHGRKVDPGKIRKTVLLTVEGERDDICAPGQTVAAHDLCTGIKPFMKRHHLQAGVGHYGVFSGRRWESQIYPIVQYLIHAAD